MANYATNRTRTAAVRQRMAELAGRVAEGQSISAAAREMGIAQQSASQLFQKICADLGEQAR